MLCVCVCVCVVSEYMFLVSGCVIIWCKMSSVSCSYADILIKSIKYLYISWRKKNVYDVLYMQPYMYMVD